MRNERFIKTQTGRHHTNHKPQRHTTSVTWQQPVESTVVAREIILKETQTTANQRPLKNSFTVIANFQPRRVRDDEKIPIPSKNKPLCLRGKSNKKSKAEFLLSSMIMIFQLIFLPCIAIKKIVSHGKTMAYYT